jgi:hypothetical protein
VERQSRRADLPTWRRGVESGLPTSLEDDV